MLEDLLVSHSDNRDLTCGTAAAYCWVYVRVT